MSKWLLLVIGLMSSISTANAYRCSTSSQLERPDWMQTYGLNNNDEQIYGFSETRPKWRQSLEEINQLLQAQALSNLAINIRANVKSSIVSEQTYINDKSEERTVIKGSTASQLSLGFLSGTQYFIDQNNCVAYARVGIPKSQLPFVFAYSDFKMHQQKLEDGNVSMADISDFKLIEAVLNETINSGSAEFLVESVKLELKRAKADTDIAEVELRTRQSTREDGPAREQLKKVNRILSAIETLNANGLESDRLNKSREKLEQVKDTISAILGKNLTAIFWTADDIANEAVEGVLQRNRERFYYTKSIGSLEGLIKQAKNYELKDVIHIVIQKKNGRRLSFDEVDISIELHYIDTLTAQRTKSETTQFKAIGRPITDEAIKSKIEDRLEGLL